MNREEAKMELMSIYGSLSSNKQIAIDTLLEQEPCTDAVSREAVLSLWGLRLSDKEIYMAIHDMESVTPKLTECEDTISREDAIKALQNVVCISAAIKSRMVGAINELPPVTQKSGKWIPFSERIPKPYEYCLITTTGGEVIYHYDDGHYSKYKAWMPLPKPYEPRESEEQTE